MTIMPGLKSYPLIHPGIASLNTNWRDDPNAKIALEALGRLYKGNPWMDFKTLVSHVAEKLEAASHLRPHTLDHVNPSQTPAISQQGKGFYCTYIDRFCGQISLVKDKIDYLKALGVGYFHPLPLLKPREGDSDGGFAVADFRDVDPRLGTFDDLKSMAIKLREADIGLVLDIVCNHTAKEHEWAQGWLRGDPRFKDFYIHVKSPSEVNAWEVPLTDVFPDTAPGNFTYVDEAEGYVWTTFYPFQWDLNYRNPAVFIEMLDVFLYLANAGVQGFRLDSAPFLWKEKGTNCRNLSQTHDIVMAWKALVNLVAPSVFFLAEAIENIDEVIPFFGHAPDHSECDLAYNNTVMTALWAALAEGQSDIFDLALSKASQIPDHGLWLNYVRCHDDIIWSALDNIADKDRQKRWSEFYEGYHSFADGAAFQAPAGSALSTCGMAASLVGFSRDAYGPARLKLLYAIMFALPGIPMIYMGDEVGLENDPSFASDPERANELRWLHRPKMQWHDASPIYDFMMQCLEILRSQTEMSALGPARPITSVADSILAFERVSTSGRFICVGNLMDTPTAFSLPSKSIDILSQQKLDTDIILSAYDFKWIWEPR